MRCPMNTFKFWPVGQGLFYTGSILNGDFNFIYDCGSDDEEYINKCVDMYLGTLQCPKTIDFVVISHLHKDHFSGLYRLARNAKIKKIYLPYLGDDNEIKTLILAKAVFGERNGETRENLFEIFNFMLYLYHVESDTTNGFRDIRIETDFINENIVDADEDGLYTQQTACEINSYWKFSLISKLIDPAKYAALNAQILALLKKEKVRSVLQLINTPNGIKEISEVYELIFKKAQNPTSIILIHQPIFELQTFSQRTNLFDIFYFNYYYYPYCYSPYFLQNIHNNCTRLNVSLLTGDACFNNKLISIVSKELNDNTLFMVQVPHHGAKAEWQKFQKGKFKTLQYVISYGLGNKYYHPNKETVNGIFSERIRLISVNQNESYIYWID